MTINWFELEKYPNTWKWIWLIALIANASSFFSLLAGGYFDIFNTILSGLIIVSLYGLGYEKPFWSITIWRITFWFMMSFIIFVLVIAGIRFFTGSIVTIYSSIKFSEPLFEKILNTAGCMLFITELRGLYLYAYKRENIWESKNSESDET